MLLLPPLLMLILFLALLTKAKINTDTEVFLQKPTETIRTLNCRHRHRNNIANIMKEIGL